MSKLHTPQSDLRKTYVNGEWVDGDPPLLTASAHATWLASMVFDGARAFSGMAPDLDQHCQRVVQSALNFGLKPMLSGPEIEAIAWEGIGLFGDDVELYVRPMYWSDGGFVIPDPEATRFAMVINEVPLPKPTGFSACLSSYCRPAPQWQILMLMVWGRVYAHNVPHT